jgi:hypothetical protein
VSFFYQLPASTRAGDSSPYLTYLTLGAKTLSLFFANCPCNIGGLSIPSHLASPLAFKRAIKTHVSKLDQLEWKAALNEPAIAQTGLSAREHCKRLKESKIRERYLYTGDRKSTLFKFYLRSRTLGLNARTQHGDPGPLTDARKACSLYDSQHREDKMHFVLVCPAHTSVRRLMWLNIEGNLLQGNLHQEWLDISLSPPRLQLDYLLGKSKSTWHFDTASVIDRHFRQFVLSAASSRKSTLGYQIYLLLLLAFGIATHVILYFLQDCNRTRMDSAVLQQYNWHHATPAG